MAKLTREQTAEGIIQLAEDAGVADNAIFKKTLERYLTLQDILDNYEKSMAEDGLEVKKYMSKVVAIYMQVLLLKSIRRYWIAPTRRLLHS